MATLSLQRNHQGIPTRFILYAPEHYDVVKTIITRGTGHFSRANRRWTMAPDPLFYRNMLQHIPGLQIDQAVLDYLTALSNAQKQLLQAIETEAPLDIDDGLWGGTQRASVRFLETGRRVILGHEMGIGKTVITCYALRHIFARRVVILCPNSVKWSWVDHLKDWTDCSNIVIVDSAMTKKKAAELEDIVIAGKREDRDLQLTKHCRVPDVVIIINFDQLRLHADVLSGYEWDVMVVDEAHRIKNPKALQTKAAVKLSRMAANAWLVTGTPARNKLMDLWQLLNICDPYRFSGYWNFINYHFETVQTNFGTEIIGLKNPDEFNAMLSRYMFRRTKAEALPELPEKIYRDIRLPLRTKQERVYREMEEEFVIEVTKQLENGKEIKDILLAPNVAAQLIRLRQICLTPALLGSVPESAKLDALAELIEDIDGSFILYSCFRSFLPYLSVLLDRKNIPYGVIAGGQDSQSRMQVQRDLQEGKLQVVIGTIQSMGEGMNLQTATTAVFCDTDWVPAVNHQAEDRIHRAGIKTSPTIIRLYHPGTVEADIMKACERKERMIDSTVGQVEVIRSLLKRGGVVV